MEQDIVVTFDPVAAYWSPRDAWQATVGDYDLYCTAGYGKTPLDAIVDLLDQLES